MNATQPFGAPSTKQIVAHDTSRVPVKNAARRTFLARLPPSAETIKTVPGNRPRPPRYRRAQTPPTSLRAVQVGSASVSVSHYAYDTDGKVTTITNAAPTTQYIYSLRIDERCWHNHRNRAAVSRHCSGGDARWPPPSRRNSYSAITSVSRP